MLIDFDKIEQTDDHDSKGNAGTIDMNFCGNIAIGNLNKAVLPFLNKDSCFQYVTNGHWSMHQLLDMILKLTGPADVYISSYAFSETPARMMAELKSLGVIRKFYCLIDSRIDVRSAGALQLLMNTADKLKLCATHAKVTVVDSLNYYFVIVGSANYTTNKRYEAGIIQENRTVAEWNIQWIMNEINRTDE